MKAGQRQIQNGGREVNVEEAYIEYIKGWEYNRYERSLYYNGMKKMGSTKSVEYLVHMILMDRTWHRPFTMELFALQHRGQKAVGIAVTETQGPRGVENSYKGMGLVNEVFTPWKIFGIKR